MPTILLQTTIHSSIEICFDLARSIDLHMLSTADTYEKAVAGITSGLINLNETVTWQATHFGIRQELTSKITAFERPHHFRDEQQKGAFRYIIHDHYFDKVKDVVIMKDVFRFQSPFGLTGRIIDRFILFNYLRKLLIKRNNTIKEFAESAKWKDVLAAK